MICRLILRLSSSSFNPFMRAALRHMRLAWMKAREMASSSVMPLLNCRACSPKTASHPRRLLARRFWHPALVLISNPLAQCSSVSPSSSFPDTIIRTVIANKPLTVFNSCLVYHVSRCSSSVISDSAIVSFTSTYLWKLTVFFCFVLPLLFVVLCSTTTCGGDDVDVVDDDVAAADGVGVVVVVGVGVAGGCGSLVEVCVSISATELGRFLNNKAYRLSSYRFFINKGML
mmetsp:Transcript_19226/g.32945  ORF Transcript_19226/g.32945 Transcript_19226/m.32945 type:complete len:230 (+) Transcript_19226:356-1045(+)